MSIARKLALALVLLPVLATLKGDPSHHLVRVYMKHAFVFSDGTLSGPGCRWIEVYGRTFVVPPGAIYHVVLW
jgi:hypothetical protein